MIAYAFAPLKTVGALRPTYWAEEIAQNSDISLDVVTATPDSDSGVGYNRIYVPNESKSIMSFLIKDEGLTWRKSLKTAFDKMDLSQYSFVIITGGPFFHFSIGTYLKKKGLSVIYDYRDPFSYNPRFDEKGLKRLIKKSYERKYLKSADAVIAVNDACHEFIGDNLILNRAIIPNGFDERIHVEKSNELKYDLFYAGKFYWEPIAFLDVIKDMSLSLGHAGMQTPFNHSYTSTEYYKYLGLMDQQTMYEQLAKSGIGVVFTSEIPFESTTKIYDYLYLNKKMLIVTLGEPGTGVLNRELEGYPYYRWVKNDKDEIRSALVELINMEVKPINVDRFSRKKGLESLISVIRAL